MRKLAISSVLLLATLAAAQTATKPFTITVAPAPLTITTVSLAAAQVGVAYNQPLTASGGTQPYTWSISAGTLPAGLTLSATGIISGTPTAAGSSNFTVQVKDATAVAHSVDVKWNPSATPGVTATNIYRNGTQIGVALTPQSTFTDTAVVSGNTYIYKVTAFNGNESAFSNTATVTVP